MSMYSLFFEIDIVYIFILLSAVLFYKIYNNKPDLIKEYKIRIKREKNIKRYKKILYTNPEIIFEILDSKLEKKSKKKLFYYLVNIYPEILKHCVFENYLIYYILKRNPYFLKLLNYKNEKMKCIACTKFPLLLDYCDDISKNLLEKVYFRDYNIPRKRRAEFINSLKQKTIVKCLKNKPLLLNFVNEKNQTREVVFTAINKDPYVYRYIINKDQEYYNFIINKNKFFENKFNNP